MADRYAAGVDPETGRVFRQRIPRPASARRVGAEQEGLGITEPERQLAIGAIRDAFAAGGDPAAQASPAPGDVASAVLLALVPDAGATPAIVLIRRAAWLRANPGEIAFPGGRIEPGEAPLAAALREAEEEVALPEASVRLLGPLAPLRRNRFGDVIWPFVGEVGDAPSLEANPDEVDEVLVVPLSRLVEPGRHWREQWDPAGEERLRMDFFDLGDDLVWGATARMLASFLSRVAGRAELPGFA